MAANTTASYASIAEHSQTQYAPSVLVNAAYALSAQYYIASGVPVPAGVQVLQNLDTPVWRCPIQRQQPATAGSDSRQTPGR